MFKRIAEVSDEMGYTQPVINRGYKFAEESGEFMVEIGAKLKITNKKEGPDGVVGEAADVMITCLDIVHRLFPDLTEEQFAEVVERKLAKWKRKLAK